MKKLTIIIFLLILLGCDKHKEEYCLKCTEGFYIDKVDGALSGGGYLYSTILIERFTTIECSDTYVGPYRISGQAFNPQDGTDYNWSYKDCIEYQNQ